MTGPSRRDVLVGGSLLAGAGGAVAMAPRDRLVLMPNGQKLEDVVPEQVGDWMVAPSSEIVLPKPKEGSLATRLYGDQLARFYSAGDAMPIFLVMAYGQLQNDTLQLHRPEACYSAVGFEIQNVRAGTLDVTPTVRVPVRDLVARSDTRVETITYWTRIGDDLPTDGTQQRLVKLRQQWDGFIADGILVRLSVAAPPSPEVLSTLRTFALQLLRSVDPAALPVLIGRPLSRALLATAPAGAGA